MDFEYRQRSWCETPSRIPHWGGFGMGSQTLQIILKREYQGCELGKEEKEGEQKMSYGSDKLTGQRRMCLIEM